MSMSESFVAQTGVLGIQLSFRIAGNAYGMSTQSATVGDCTCATVSVPPLIVQRACLLQILPIQGNTSECG
jgi:hypothetical protein